MEKVWVIADPDKYLEDLKSKPKKAEELLPIGKNPARAYTLSIFFWGGGQLYNGQRAKGEWFLFVMLLVCTVPILLFNFWLPLIEFLRYQNISYAGTFLFTELLFFCALIFWTHNAGDAYHTAAKTRRNRFTGVTNHVYPFLCSLLIPGWGQFLNGQPVKGSIFTGLSVLSLFSLTSITTTWLAWPYFAPSDTRFAVEAIFAISMLFAPLIPFIWLFGCFDALKVSLDELKKEPVFSRIKAANNRRRERGLVDGVFPSIKSAVVLGLVFTFIIIVANYYYFPKKYYIDQFQYVQATFQKQGMTLVPALIDGLRLAIASAQG